MSIKSLMPKAVTAMPQLIPQEDLGMELVNLWKKRALAALKYRNGKSSENLKLLKMDSTNLPLWHYQKSPKSGVFFVMNGPVCVYLYAYEHCVIDKKPSAVEALAYVFTQDGRGLMKEVFFTFMLPHLKFVVTDYIYTPQGKSWFEAEYNFAFTKGYKIYAIDLEAGSVTSVDKRTFDDLQKTYWGDSKEFHKYRFAIEAL